MIQFGREESHLETIVEKKGMEFQIDMHLKKNSPKGIAINKIPIRKASELFGIVHFVFFSPEDLNIIKDGPAGRRRFIDLELSRSNKVYLSNLSNYNRIINQRNSLLKGTLSPGTPYGYAGYLGYAARAIWGKSDGGQAEIYSAGKPDHF